MSSKVNFKAFICSFCLFLSLTSYVQGQNYEAIADSLQQMLQHTTLGEKRVDLLNQISYNYRRTSPEKILEFAEKAKKESLQIDYKKGLCIAYKNMGIAYYKLGKPLNLTANYYHLAIKLAEEINDYYTQAACNNNIALLYNQSLDYNTALKYYLKGIDIFDQHFDTEERLKSLMIANVSSCFFQLKDYHRALEYGQRAISTARRNNQTSILSMYLDDLAKIYTQLDQLDKSEVLLQEAQTIQKSLGDHQSYLQTVKNLIELRLKMQQLKDSKQLIKNAIQLAQDKEFKPLIPGLFIALGKVFLFENKYDSTIHYANYAYQKAIESEDMPDKKEALYTLSAAYNKIGQYQKAYELFHTYHIIQDSMQNADKFAETSRLESIYQNKVKAQQIEFLQQEKSSQKSRIKLLWILSFIAFSSLWFLLYFFYKNYQKNKIIEHKNKELKKYISSNLQLENFAYIASHDLKTPLRTIVSFTQLLERKIKKNLTDTETDFLNHIINGAREMTVLIEDLLSYAVIEKKKLKLEKIPIKVLIEHLLTEIKVYIDEHSAQIHLNIQTDTIVGDPMLIKHVLQNLLTNAIKFNQEGQSPEIWLNLYETKNQWHFEVKDNGIGIEEEFYEKIFLIFKRLNNKLDYEGSGIGLAICKKVVDLHKGEIWLESQKGQGTSFFFSIPMTKVETKTSDKVLSESFA